MIEADIQVQAGDWACLVDDPVTLAGRAVAAVSEHERAKLQDTAADFMDQEVSVVLSDDARVRGLNRRYRGQDKPTNVLAFPPPIAMAIGKPPEPGHCLGDVVLAFETVKREAEAQKKPFANHMTHLIVHGALHLLGYDHEEERDAARMEAEETAILRRLGIPDPYMTDTAKEAGTAPDG
ncbi:MAG: rRNA maturation RNase YbeY [Alphaproteobacteria bacterium]